MSNLESVIVKSSTLELESGGLHTINIQVSEHIEVTLVAPKRTKGNALINVLGEGQLKLNVVIEESANWAILEMNQSDNAIVFEERWTLKKNSNLLLAVGELTAGSHVKNVNYDLAEEGATINVRGATLVQSKLEAVLTANHIKGNTYAEINTYGIVLKECTLKLDVVGVIKAKAKNSKTHQTSRVMNFDTKPNTSVNPQLVIDENDVEASHAASVGQPDVLQVYYLQSRGMSRSESLKLISLGYLMPIVDVIENEVVKEALREAVINKVAESCLI
ncbi:MAG: SufD family Fe-S cluster assembly protein [Erysipelotrichia bacterium]|nr:SufD family Fe-S cluster assembly protein [Erysipelotrichia bacterium]